jgi:uncharacterized protein DUF3631
MPLLAIADEAGGDWPDRARAAARALSGPEANATHDESRRVQLLADIQVVFARRKDPAVILTRDLLGELNADDESPWGGWNQGEGLRDRDLAGLLRPFAIAPHTLKVKIENEVVVRRGYRRRQFEEAWSRYRYRRYSAASIESTGDETLSEDGEGSGVAEVAAEPDPLETLFDRCGGARMTDGFIGQKSVAAPDLIDYVIGVRGFDRNGHHLASPFQGMTWDRAQIRAVCRPGKRTAKAALVSLGAKPGPAGAAATKIVARQYRLGEHAAPHPLCSCGIYGYHEADAAHLAQPIIGVIRAHGRIQVHAGGFRAEYAEIVAISFDDELGSDIPDQRYREVARRWSTWWQIPLLRRDELAASLSEFGSSVPVDLRPQNPKENAS